MNRYYNNNIQYYLLFYFYKSVAGPQANIYPTLFFLFVNQILFSLTIAVHRDVWCTKLYAKKLVRFVLYNVTKSLSSQFVSRKFGVQIL